MEKNYRIHTNITNDTVLNVNMQQDYDFLEVLTLKLRTSDAYRLHSSNYGVIIGRVLANDAFGIPNARVSVFIERDVNDPIYMESIYPYKEVTNNDRNGRRYNLLPDYNDDDCYRVVGTFPNKRLVLDDNVELEIYDKYWKYTTVTNNAGDYMIFGVPSGSQQIHVDMDLSDIGILSQTPRDFEYKGYNMTMFDSPSQFKESSNLDSLAQIFSQNKSVFVYPFWGDSNLDNGIAAITRCDVQIQYKFEPTCVFMGSIFSDNEGNSIGHKCAANVDNGMNYQLVTGEGTIEMIRKTTDGLIEEYPIQGNQLIDSNGVWCYQIPMNLDFIGTDEYGNIVPTDNPNKGIPTRTQVRFRFSKTETGNEGHSRHTAKYLVPMNPTLVGSTPKAEENGAYIESMYKFGSSTPEDCFRDLYWNNVYSVKNYIPKLQIAHRPYAPNYTGLKGSNLATDQNPIPFNKLRIDIPVIYVIVCIIFRIVILVVQIINIVINIFNTILNIFEMVRSISILGIRPFGLFPSLCCIGCVTLGGGLSPDNTAYFPSCDNRGMDAAECPADMENCKKSASPSKLTDLVQQKLAEDYKIIKLDFYQDWLNGSLYMPLWFWRKRKKKSYLFGLIPVSAKNEYCDCNRTYSRLKSYVTCNIVYADRTLKVNDGSMPEDEDNWHRSKSRADNVGVPYGIIKGVENKDGLTAYYYAAIQPTGDAEIMPMEKRQSKFLAFRSFATDIILLGNLNENNLYGLPQFFKALPSTTANIPPIASVEESADDDTISTSENVLADQGETGPSLVTGMDWIDGEGTPEYSEGLFMLLSCTYAHTKAKSCINVERLSELGMNLDMRYDASYPSSSGLRIGTFEPDGLITKYELDDTENRAMFATMNHLGFVPQPYQDKHANFNETQILDENTNYYIPKFKYMYPIDLDGRMSPLIDRYRNGFQQIMSDDRDETYINFRLGDVQGTSKGGQFYRTNSMPLYNNSFYFYFGINKGNTAIDKFNKMFNAECFKNNKSPFSLSINTRPKSYCPTIYKTEYQKSMIEVSSDDIQIPYSYTLVDGSGNTFSSDTNISDSGFVIEDVDNSLYVLTITDSNGRRESEKINISLDNIVISYETRGLGIKYYEHGNNEDICDELHELYGKITFDSVFVDGYEFKINDGGMSCIGATQESSYTYSITGTFINDNVFNDNAILSMDLREENNNALNDYLCLNNDNRPLFTSTTVNDSGEEITVYEIRVKRPCTLMMDVYEMCEGIRVSGNNSTFAATIENGKNFYGYINKMPIKFMEENYYDKQNNLDVWVKNWLNVHKESAFTYPQYDEANREYWSDFLSLSDNLNDSYNKNQIIKYKFSTIFNLSKGVYAVSNGGSKFTFTGSGGVQPLLYRSLAPYYKDVDKATNTFIYSDNNYVTMNQAFPNIVGNNYNDGEINEETTSPRINRLYEGRQREHLGNYFMVATNNGGYVSTYEGKCEEYVVTQPMNAAVNLTSDWKKLGSDIEMDRIPEIVYSTDNMRDEVCDKQSMPYFNAMFVDRRLDYDLIVFGGMNNLPFEIADETDRLKTTTIRILGNFYNGIEMSYDENYNIISATYESGYTTHEEDGELIIEADTTLDKVLSSNTLEYTYEYDSGNTTNVHTIYNEQESGCTNWDWYWKKYDDKVSQLIYEAFANDATFKYYDPTNGYSANTPVLKELYAANVKNIDIRQLMWSSENECHLEKIVENSSLNNWTGGTLPFYLYSASTDSYGSLLFKEDNYPTKKWIDMGKISPSSYLQLAFTPCSYDLNLQLDSETNLFTSEINEGSGFETLITFGSIKPSPRGEKEEYGHLVYNFNNPTSPRSSEISKICIGINYKSTSYEGFTAYSTRPRVMSVDDVQKLKEKSYSSATSSISAYSDIGTQLQYVTVNKALQILEENKWWPMEILNETYPYHVGEDGYIYYGNEILSSDNDYLYNCRIDASTVKEFGENGPYTCRQIGGIENFNFVDENLKFITVCAMRTLVPTKENNLSSRINVFDFSEFYDCGDIKATCGKRTEGDETIFDAIIYGDSDNQYVVKHYEKVGAVIATSTLRHGKINSYPLEKDGNVDYKKRDNNLIVTVKYKIDQYDAYSDSLFLYITCDNGIIYKLYFNFDD